MTNPELRLVVDKEKPSRAGFLAIMRMEREISGMWAYVPVVAARIRAFAEKYLDDSGELLAETFQRHFAIPDKDVRQGIEAGYPYVKAFILFDPTDFAIKGHLIVQIETQNGRRIAAIRQYQLDVPAPSSLLERGFLDIEEFAREYSADRMILKCRSQALERRFARLGFGFKYIEMEKEL